MAKKSKPIVDIKSEMIKDKENILYQLYEKVGRIVELLKNRVHTRL